MTRLLGCGLSLVVCTVAAAALSGCDPTETGLTVTNQCADEQVIAVGDGYDPRRSAEELGWAAVSLETGAVYSGGSLDAGAAFYVVIAAGTPQERLEVVSADPGERDAFYTIAGSDCAPSGTSTLAPNIMISREPPADQ